MTKTNVSLKTMKTMKKYSFFLSVAFAVFALASCQKEQDNSIKEVIDDSPRSVPFVLRADIPSVDTKTTLNTSTWAVDWEDGDVIYAVTTDEAWGQAYPVDANETIAEFAYDSVNGTFSTDMAIADGSHTFNFLYTASQQKSFHRGASTTFQLAGTQTFDASDPTASLKLYDALAAQVDATTPTSFADVDMSHIFTLMKVTLKNKTGESVNISKFEIEIPDENLSGIFTVNFSSTPTTTYKSGGGDKITVNISNGTVANNGTLDVYFVMGAVSGYTGEVTFTVTDSADNTYTKTNTISAPGVTFAAGTYNTASYSLKTVDPPLVTSWVETAIGSLSAGDVIAIVDKASSTAMTNDNGTSNPPEASSVIISGSNITSTVADNMQWVLEIPSAGSYSFKVSGSTNYLYTTNTNNGVRVGSNANKVFTFVENDGNSTYYLNNTGTSRILGVYTSNNDWRCYTSVNDNIKDTRTAFYKKTSTPAPSHSISITSPSNGTVVTSPATTAYETATVTITATPDDGYAVSAVNVVDGSSNNVSTTPVDATHYSFTMPSDDVTVSVTFSRVYTITATAANGSIDVAPASTAFAGETITITATPNSGYAFSSWSVAGATPASTTDNPTTFTMPAGDVSVTASFVSAKTITRLIESIDDVPAAGTDPGELDDAYELTNATDGDLNVTYDGTVVTDAEAVSGSVLYVVSANTGGARSGWIRIAVAGGNTIQIGVNQLAGSIDYSSVYTSNVTLSTTGGTSASTANVSIADISYDAIKAGTSKAQGAVKITVPSGATKLNVHIAGWNGENVSISVTPSTKVSKINNVTGNTMSLTADSGVSGSGTTYTLNGTSYLTTNYYKVIDLTGISEDTELTFTATSGNRFVIWGVNAE